VTTRVPISADAPFFIVGAQRSGTTLLRLMLAAHPRLAIPPESHFIPDLLRLERRTGGLERRRDEVARLLVQHDRLVDFELESDWIRDTVQRLTPLTTRTITLALFEAYAKRQGKPRWGDKTPRYRAFLPELRTLFPDARFIHVVRDGRDTALSAWRAPFGPRTWVHAVYFWRDAIRETQRAARAVPPDILGEVRYEALLTEPETTLRRVCDFLGEGFHDDMLRYAEQASRIVPAWERSWHAKLERPLDGGNAGKWRRQLSPQQIALFERVAGRELAAFGYPSVPVDVSIAMAARIGLERARYRARHAAARTMTRLRRAEPMSPTAFRAAASAAPAGLAHVEHGAHGES
jgi:hypothetical protein